MTIHVTEPEVPRRLPPAQLHLDDIKHIVDLFARAENEVRKPRLPDEPAKLTFKVGDRITDQIDDLPKITKRTRDLAVTLDRPGFTLKFEANGGDFVWWAYGLTRTQQWPIFHQLEVILKPKNTRLRLAQVLAYTLGIISASLLFAAARAALLAHIATSTWWSVAAGVIAGAALIRLVPQGNVTLRYSHDEAARREERRSALWNTIAGGLVGLLAGMALEAFTKLLEKLFR